MVRRILALVLAICMLIACTELALSMYYRAHPEASKNPTKEHNAVGRSINDWVDKETGCHYITIGDAITARLDKFGQPMCPGTTQPRAKVGTL